MARDIDVDEQELSNFIQTLAAFQELTTDKFKAVMSDWRKCDESWQGESKEEFTRQFEETQRSVDSTLNAGEDALRWLQRFDEIVKDFEGGY